MTAQKKVIRTNLVKTKIDRSHRVNKCWVYGEVDVSVNHLEGNVSKMGLREDCEDLKDDAEKDRLSGGGGGVARAGRKSGLKVGESWFHPHQPEASIEKRLQ